MNMSDNECRIFGSVTVVGEILGFSKPVLCLCACGKEFTRKYKELVRQERSGGRSSCGCLRRRPVKAMVGLRFGRLVVLSELQVRHDKKAVWRCLCDCGKTKDILGKSLRSGLTTSCGCYAHEIATQKEDLTGKQVGRLTILGYVGKNTHNNLLWECRCSCGNIVTIRAGSLKNKQTQSCGCLQKERASVSGKVQGPLRLQEYFAKVRIEAGGDPEVPLTPATKLARLAIQDLAAEVKRRDGYRCRVCGEGGKLHSHHIFPFHKFKALRNCRENLITLCLSCHKRAHKGGTRKTCPKFQRFLVLLRDLEAVA